MTRARANTSGGPPGPEAGGTGPGGGRPPASPAPSASLASLRKRAGILAWIRDFFRRRGVLEVETPLLCAAGSVDEHLDPIPARLRLSGAGSEGWPFWLVTSPEHSMKRLLAAGSGPIYTITRSFRDGERGRLHNPEFTILEWYRPGMDHLALMDEVEELCAGVLEAFGDGSGVPRPFDRLTYAQAFERALRIDPHRAPVEELARLAGARATAGGSSSQDRDGWLDLLLATRMAGTLGIDRPAFLFDYPATQASSGRVQPGDPPVAERFELFVTGVEIANGYHELLDGREQERRYRDANRRREAAGKPALPIDLRLLAALEEGLPECAGVALGLDRLVMLALGARLIDEVIAFPIERA